MKVQKSVLSLLMLLTFVVFTATAQTADKQTADKNKTEQVVKKGGKSCCGKYCSQKVAVATNVGNNTETALNGVAVGKTEATAAVQNVEKCPWKGTPDCPLLKSCPWKGTPACPLVK